VNDQNHKITILFAEDDPDECLLVQKAFQEIDTSYDIFSVPDGIELLQYLNKEGIYAAPAFAPRPDLILLDLNMPRLDGRQALAAIKSNPDLRSIPVVVLTNSYTHEDILRTYDLGGAGYILKPLNFANMIDIVKVLNEYWFEVVELASGERVRNLKKRQITLPSPG
jgi:CheY-like chemotaxis protein